MLMTTGPGDKLPIKFAQKSWIEIASTLTYNILPNWLPILCNENKFNCRRYNAQTTYVHLLIKPPNRGFRDMNAEKGHLGDPLLENNTFSKSLDQSIQSDDLCGKIGRNFTILVEFKRLFFTCSRVS